MVDHTNYYGIPKDISMNGFNHKGQLCEVQYGRFGEYHGKPPKRKCCVFVHDGSRVTTLIAINLSENILTRLIRPSRGFTLNHTIKSYKSILLKYEYFSIYSAQ